jgi:hypothetical protein
VVPGQDAPGAAALEPPAHQQVLAAGLAGLEAQRPIAYVKAGGKNPDWGPADVPAGR